MPAPLVNQRYNIAWKYIRNKLYTVQRAAWNDEDMMGRTERLSFIAMAQMALDYCTLIYTDITLPDHEVGAETWDEVKARFDFDNMKTYFVKQGINLTKIAGFFDLEVLAPLNLDTQIMVDAQPDNDIPTYP